MPVGRNCQYYSQQANKGQDQANKGRTNPKKKSSSVPMNGIQSGMKSMGRQRYLNKVQQKHSVTLWVFDGGCIVFTASKQLS